MPVAWRATAIGLIAKTRRPEARRQVTRSPREVLIAIGIGLCGLSPCSASSRSRSWKPAASSLILGLQGSRASESTIATSGWSSAQSIPRVTCMRAPFRAFTVRRRRAAAGSLGDLIQVPPAHHPISRPWPQLSPRPRSREELHGSGRPGGGPANGSDHGTVRRPSPQRQGPRVHLSCRCAPRRCIHARRPARPLPELTQQRPSTPMGRIHLALCAHLRRRGIRAVIPVPAEQRSHRFRRGRLGGRPPAFDRHADKQRNTVEGCINRLEQRRGVARNVLTCDTPERPPFGGRDSPSGRPSATRCRREEPTRRAGGKAVGGNLRHLAREKREQVARVIHGDGPRRLRGGVGRGLGLQVLGGAVAPFKLAGIRSRAHQADARSAI